MQLGVFGVVCVVISACVCVRGGCSGNLYSLSFFNEINAFLPASPDGHGSRRCVCLCACMVSACVCVG